MEVLFLGGLGGDLCGWDFPRVMGGGQNLQFTLYIPYFRVLISIPPSIPPTQAPAPMSSPMCLWYLYPRVPMSLGSLALMVAICRDSVSGIPHCE